MSGRGMVAGRGAEGDSWCRRHHDVVQKPVPKAPRRAEGTTTSINRRTSQTVYINPDQPKYVSTRYLAKNPFFLSKFYLEFLSVFFLSKIALFLSLHFGEKRYAGGSIHMPRDRHPVIN